jgi:glycosyltransferase involved in cell wall biosynthesis
MANSGLNIGERTIDAQSRKLACPQTKGEQVLQPHLLVLGDPYFLARYSPLVDALRRQFPSVDVLPIHERAILRKLLYFAAEFFSGRLWPLRRATLSACLQRFRKQPATFSRVSRLAARLVRASSPPPSMLLQIFTMSSPVTDEAHKPYCHYIDMTMALVRRQWPAWAPYESEALYNEWIALEGRSYRNAERVFTFSESTRLSVIADYGVQPERVVTVGAAGHFHDVPAGARSYGNRTLVFNGSDFERKGGDLVLETFRLVRLRFPDAQLTTLGNARVPAQAGVRSPGNIGRSELFALLDVTDILLAPTRLDVLPGFVFEAMSRGVVPILSDAPSMDEMICHDKEGYIASPTTPDRLAAYICSLFESNATLHRLGTAARERVARSWNWDSVAQAMVRALSKSLS